MKAQNGLRTHAVLQRIKSGDAEAAYELLKRLPESEQPRLGDEDADRNGGALFWACCKGYADVAALLIARGAAVDARTSWGATPLHGAADNNRADIVELLLGYGAPVNARTSGGDTPAHLAAYRGHDAVLRLLEEHGANPSARNDSGSDVRDETRRGRQLRRHDRLLSARTAEEQAAVAAKAVAAPCERVLCRSGGGDDDWQQPSADLYSRGSSTQLQRAPLTRWTTYGGYELLERGGVSEPAVPISSAKAAALMVAPERSSSVRSPFSTAAVSAAAIGNGAVTVRGDRSRSQSVPTEWEDAREYNNLTSR